MYGDPSVAAGIANRVAWLAEYGGGCDCEVIANVEDRWGEVVGSV